MPGGPNGEEGEEEAGETKKWEDTTREGAKRETHTSADPSRLPSAGRERTSASLDFPGVRFADEDIITKPHQETQVVVESMRRNAVQDTRPKEEVEEMVEVDWFGIPLANSTLPDYTSMYRHHYPNPHHYLYRQMQEQAGEHEGTAGKTRELHEQVNIECIEFTYSFHIQGLRSLPYQDWLKKKNSS